MAKNKNNKILNSISVEIDGHTETYMLDMHTLNKIKIIAKDGDILLCELKF